MDDLLLLVIIDYAFLSGKDSHPLKSCAMLYIFFVCAAVDICLVDLGLDLGLGAGGSLARLFPFPLSSSWWSLLVSGGFVVLFPLLLIVCISYLLIVASWGRVGSSVLVPCVEMHWPVPSPIFMLMHPCLVSCAKKHVAICEWVISGGQLVALPVGSHNPWAGASIIARVRCDAGVILTSHGALLVLHFVHGAKPWKCNGSHDGCAYLTWQVPKVSWLSNGRVNIFDCVPPHWHRVYSCHCAHSLNCAWFPASKMFSMHSTKLACLMFGCS